MRGKQNTIETKTKFNYKRERQSQRIFDKLWVSSRVPSMFCSREAFFQAGTLKCPFAVIFFLFLSID